MKPWVTLSLATLLCWALWGFLGKLGGRTLAPGHLLLVTFAVLTASLWSATYVGAILPGGLLVALTGFEILVAVLQAFIFTILAAVYIGGAMNPEH